MQIASSLVNILLVGGFLDSDAFYSSGLGGDNREFQVFIIEANSCFWNIA